jgi:acetyl-CoA C-acetyltransferase
LVVLDHEEFPRATTAEGLAALSPSFEGIGGARAGTNGETLDELALRNHSRLRRIDHVHTAGNSSGIADGASAVLIASKEFARARGLVPRARIRTIVIAADDPVLMLTAPTPASRKALAAAGMEIDDVDLWEMNEAFAAVPLKTMRDLGVDPDRVNVNGGSIALGHPLGATGAILVGTALDELERRGSAVALITLCIAGGQGIAAIIERI